MPDPTDPPPSDPDDVVRRRLAAARVDTPTPPEVVARLDRVLADLRAEREAPDPAWSPDTPATPPPAGVSADPSGSREPAARVETTVTRLHDRRRRRSWVSRGLAAACAVVALGGLAYVVPRAGLSGGGDASSSADSGGSVVQGAPEAAGPAAEPLPFIRPAHAAADIAQRVPTRLRAPLVTTDTSVLACVPRGDGGTGVRVSYGGRLAALVFADPVDGGQQVTVYACDGAHGGTRLRVVRLPAP